MDEDSAPVYRCPTRSPHYAENLEWFESERTAALRVPCGACRAHVGERCVNEVTGEPLKRFPAHPCRVEAAKQREGAQL